MLLCFYSYELVVLVVFVVIGQTETKRSLTRASERHGSIIIHAISQLHTVDRAALLI